VTGCLAFAKSKQSAAFFHRLDRVGAAGDLRALSGLAANAAPSHGAARGADGAADTVQGVHGATAARAADEAPAQSAGVRKEYTALTLHRVPLGRHVHWASHLSAYFGEEAPSAGSGEKVAGGKAREEGGDGGEVKGGEEKEAREKCPETPEAGDKACVLEVLACSPLAPADMCEVRSLCIAPPPQGREGIVLFIAICEARGLCYLLEFMRREACDLIPYSSSL